MSISSVIGVAAGLVFVYLLLSLMCTSAKEILEVVLRKRSTDLEAGIRQLLNDPQGVGLAKDFFEHPLISSMIPGDYKPAPQWARFFQRAKNWSEFFSNGFLSNLPSYIPSKNFAVVLADIVLRPVPTTDATGTPTPAATRTSPEAVSQTVDAPAAVEVAAVAGGAVLPKPTLCESLEKIENRQVRRALLTLAHEGENDEKHLRDGIEVWFDSAMDRVSAGYKRWTHAILFGLGLVMSAGLNVDTIAICNNLSQNPAEVQKLVDAANQITSIPAPNPAPLAIPAPNVSPVAGVELSKASGQLKSGLAQLQGLGLPIGWFPETTPRDSWGWMRKIGGLLLTTLAISMGAPFWFDVLNRVMVVRSTVKPRGMV